VINAPAAGSSGNLCGADAQGAIRIEAGPIPNGAPQLAGLPPNFYEALWNFLFGSRNVRLTGGHYHDPASGQAQSVPDSTVQLPACGAPADLSAWAGNWNFTWYCVDTGAGPGGAHIDDGQDNLSILVTGPNTVQISDGTLVYFATAVPGNPRMLTGTFQDTDGGGTYTEDFTWTLNLAGTIWTQTSSYIYTSGVATGLGGDCYGTAIR